MIIKPMLAGTVTDFSKIRYPVLASPKLDGVRCLRINGRSVSRSFKEIPNRYIQDKMAGFPDGLDGELIVTMKHGTIESFQNIVSAVMSRDGEPRFRYIIFDYVGVGYGLDETYSKRLSNKFWWFRLQPTLKHFNLVPFYSSIRNVLVNNYIELLEFENEQLRLGYEGIMIRQPNSPYKCGRSTEKEGYLLKIKRFKDSEAVIIGFAEQMENTNTLEKDIFGHAKRSSSIQGMIGKGTLGKFIVKEVGDTGWKGKEFKIGTGVGLIDQLRQDIWNNKQNYIGRLITYKYQSIGTLNLPRLPIFKGFRGNE